MTKIKKCSKNDLQNFKQKSIYVFGAGEYAKDICTALKEEGLCIKSYVIDDTYFTNTLIGDISVIPLSSFREVNCLDNVLINGVSSVKRFRQMISEDIFEEIYVWYEPNTIWTYNAAFWLEHIKELDDVNKLYADEMSRDVVKAFLNAKRNGIDESDIELASDENTYFNSLTQESYNGAYIDCGAYNGDSVEQFNRFNINKESTQVIFAFEPDVINYNLMVRKFSNDTSIHCINKGIGNEKRHLNFNVKGNMGAKFGDETVEGNSYVAVTSIDSIVGDIKVGFIKMDIEGSELHGLLGAAKTIKRDHPTLAISAYHKQEDLIKLPKYIKSFDDDNVQYKLYLRHHGICAYELVLYAIPELVDKAK